MSEKSAENNQITINLITASESVSLRVEAGENLLEALRQRPDLAPPAPCAGRGRCGKCRIILEDAGKNGVPAVHEDERATITDADLKKNIRLACRLEAVDGMKISLEEKGASRIETRAEGSDVELNPRLVKKVVVLSPGSLEDQRSASSRLEDSLVWRTPSGWPRVLFPTAFPGRSHRFPMVKLPLQWFLTMEIWWLWM